MSHRRTREDITREGGTEAVESAPADFELDVGVLNRSAELQRAGRFDEAIALLGDAARAAPRQLAPWVALAGCLFAARRPEQALQAWEAALALSPDDPVALCGKARALHGFGRAAEARALYVRTLATAGDPSQARFGLALLDLEAGRLDDAALQARELLRFAPDRLDSLWLGARIARARSDWPLAKTRLDRILANPALDPAQRAEALLLLGDVLDDLGLAAEAFAAAVLGKSLLRNLFAERAAGREAEEAKYNRLRAWFEARSPSPWPPPARLAGPFVNEAKGHVFLVGFARSGTTLLEQALAGHSHLVALDERPLLAEHYAEFLTSDEGCERLAHLSASEADTWRARYWAEVRTHGVDATGRVFLDKAPAGTVDLPLIASLFPNARILFALRDPRDVVLSCLRNAFEMNALTYAFTSLETTAACYDACMAMAEVYRARLPLDMIDVRHETLVNDFETELASITRFIGLEPETRMADIAATAARRPIRTPSAPQVRAGLNRRGVERWRAYAQDLAPVLPTLSRWVGRFGYSTD